MRITTGIMKVALIVGLIAIAMFGMGLPAMAINDPTVPPQDGPPTPTLGDPTSGTQVVPHGGYGVGTDYCLQCHQVHYNRGTQDAPGEYSLMAESSVTATCATCHGFEGLDPTGREVPDFGGLIGTASTRAVYTEAEEIHIIGAGFGSVGAIAGWDFYTWAGNGTPGSAGPEAAGSGRSAGTASYYNGGLYCGSCHTPHGEFGQLINSSWAVTSADQNNSGGTDPVTAVPWKADGTTRIWWEDPDPADPTSSPTEIDANIDPTNPWKQVYVMYDATAKAWFVSTLPNGAGDQEWAQVLDAEDQLVSLYGYKLLTSSPNHQYPTRNPNGNGQFLQPGGGYAATPPVGLYSDAPFAGGTLARSAGSPNLLTHVTLGTLLFDPGATPGGALSNLRVQFPAGATPPAYPFKVRVDEEIMMVTSGINDCGADCYTFNVIRAVEPVEPEVGCRSWGRVWSGTTMQFDRCAGVAHPIPVGGEVEVLLVPTLLVNEDTNLSVAPTLGGATPPSGTPPTPANGNPGGLKPLASYGSTSRVAVPFHIKVTVGTTTETMVVLWRTPVSGSQYLYTVARQADRSPSISGGFTAPGPGATFYVQSGVSRNSVRSWGVDRYSGDMSSFCGSCHSGPADVKFGGQYHSHPTGCAECHGNSSTSGDDFPHSSDNPLMLQALPDGLCINCHVAGTLP